MNEFLIMVALWCGQPGSNISHDNGHGGQVLELNDVPSCRRKVIKACKNKKSYALAECVLKATEE